MRNENDKSVSSNIINRMHENGKKFFWIFLDMARHAKNIDYSKKRGNLEQWGPFLIGLKYENGKWSWQDGSETDYYRWYAEEGGNLKTSYIMHLRHRNVLLSSL